MINKLTSRENWVMWATVAALLFAILLTEDQQPKKTIVRFTISVNGETKETKGYLESDSKIVIRVGNGKTTDTLFNDVWKPPSPKEIPNWWWWIGAM